MTCLAPDLTTAYPLLSDMANGQPLCELSLDVALDKPSFHGQSTFVVRPGVIDADAIELLGFSQCMLLAGAIAERAGGGFELIERYSTADGWRRTHVAGRLPNGLVLDIHGRRTVEQVLDGLRACGPWPLRNRTVGTWPDCMPGWGPSWRDRLAPLNIEVYGVFADALWEASR